MSTAYVKGKILLWTHKVSSPMELKTFIVKKMSSKICSSALPSFDSDGTKPSLNPFSFIRKPSIT